MESKNFEVTYKSRFNETFEEMYKRQFNETFEDTKKIINNYTLSIVPEKELRETIYFSTDWQTDFVCRRYCEIEDILKEYHVLNKEDLNRRLANSDKLGEAQEQFGLPFEAIFGLSANEEFITVIDPLETSDSYGEEIIVSTRDITIDFQNKEIVIYEECDNEEWARLPFDDYKKTWWLMNQGKKIM